MITHHIWHRAKNLLLFLLLSINIFSQKKEKIIFLYEGQKDTVITNKKEDIYKLDNKHTFKFVKEKHEKTEVDFLLIKEDIISFDDFIKINKGEKYPEFFNRYSFYIFFKKKKNIGFLIEVEKIWMVEDKIID